jgi:hypothetical protein
MVSFIFSVSRCGLSRQQFLCRFCSSDFRLVFTDAEPRQFLLRQSRHIEFVGGVSPEIAFRWSFFLANAIPYAAGWLLRCHTTPDASRHIILMTCRHLVLVTVQEFIAHYAVSPTLRWPMPSPILIILRYYDVCHIEIFFSTPF